MKERVLWVGPYVVVGLPFVILSLRVATQTTGTPTGDLALIQLATLEASQFERLLGAYSWRGWNHPGPVFFYLVAPFYRLVGETPGLSVGTVLVHLAAALGVVAVARRIAGDRAAWAGAAVVAAWAAALGTAALRNPWNPRVVVIAMLLLVTLAARAAATPGSWWALAGAGIVGSAITQSHIGPAMTVCALVGVAGVRVLWLRGTDLRSARWWLGCALVTAALTVMWAPVVWQQFTVDPGNIRSLFAFISNGMSSPGVREQPPSSWDALEATMWQVSTLPFGLTPPVGRPSLPNTRVVIGIALVVAGVAACAWAARTRLCQVAWLAGLTLAGLVIAALSASRLPMQVRGYFLFWVAGVAVGAPLAAAILAGLRWPRVGMAVAVTAGVIFAWTAVTGPVAYEETDPSMRADMVVVNTVDENLPPGRSPVHLRWDDNRWKIGTAVLLRLRERGHQVTVDRDWAWMVGELWTTGPPADTVVDVVARRSSAGRIQSAMWSGELLAATPDTLVFLHRMEVSRSPLRR